MKIEFFKADALQTFLGVQKPSITGATRLETWPSTIGMLTSLQAPVADPLWMLSRQWQFNEFQGEDAGTPLRIKFALRGTAVDAFRPGANEQASWQSLDAQAAPLETRVEAEAAWAVHARLRGEAVHDAPRNPRRQGKPRILDLAADRSRRTPRAGMSHSGCRVSNRRLKIRSERLAPGTRAERHAQHHDWNIGECRSTTISTNQIESVNFIELQILQNQ